MLHSQHVRAPDCRHLHLHDIAPELLHSDRSRDEAELHGLGALQKEEETRVSSKESETER